MAQALLETGEKRLFVARLDVDHAIWSEPGLRDRGSEQVLASDAPQDLAERPGGDSGGEAR